MAWPQQGSGSSGCVPRWPIRPSPASFRHRYQPFQRTPTPDSEPNSRHSLTRSRCSQCARSRGPWPCCSNDIEMLDVPCLRRWLRRLLLPIIWMQGLPSRSMTSGPTFERPPKQTASPSSRFSGTSAVRVVLCRRGDLNPHALAGTSPSSWRVCLFRHSDECATRMSAQRS
jgi:hypothetical protein